MLRSLFVFGLLAAHSIHAQNGLKIVTSSGLTSRVPTGISRVPTRIRRAATRIETQYLLGPRIRMESAYGVSIHQCDQRRLVQLNPAAKTYRILEIGADGNIVSARPPAVDRQAVARRPKVHFSVTTEDTGERATIFGYPAWHVRDTLVRRPEAPLGSPGQTVTDYWYVDLPPAVGCMAFISPFMPEAGPGVTVTKAGEAKRGFAVLSRHVRKLGVTESEEVLQVTELKATELAASLFEIPPDYQPALESGGRVYMDTPDTTANRVKMAWRDFWEGAAKFLP